MFAFLFPCKSNSDSYRRRSLASEIWGNLFVHDEGEVHVEWGGRGLWSMQGASVCGRRATYVKGGRVGVGKTRVFSSMNLTHPLPLPHL